MNANDLMNSISVGQVLINFRKGTSRIEKIDENKIVYKRKKTPIYFYVKDFLDAYNTFRGRTITSKDLSEYNGKVFDRKQNAHSCNCTMFFMILQQIGLAEVWGEGHRGNLFTAKIK